MPNTRDLRRRIKSVKNTAQITKAMQMVSAAKMRKAQNQAMASRPYTATLANVLSQILSGQRELDHPLVRANKSEKVGILLISSDKGLCGALNTNLFRFIQSSDLLKQSQVSFYSLGKKGRDFIVRTGKNLEADFENHEKITFSDAVRIRKFIVESFKTQKIGQAYLLYPQFISTLRQEAKLVKILPVDLKALAAEVESLAVKDEFLFEPDINSLLDFSLNHFIDTQIYQALVETKASEHSARMIAMQNATDNAKDLVDDLTLTYNRVRQENITRELLEITSAAAALV